MLTRNVTQDSQQDVNQEIRPATTLEKDTDGWDKDRKDDLNDVADIKNHGSVWSLTGTIEGKSHC